MKIFTPQKKVDRTIRGAGKFDQEYYEEENYEYGRRYRDMARKIVPRILREIHPEANWRILDVGCALGGIVEVLRKRGLRAYGIDLSRWCIRTSPVRQYLRFGSVTNLPCPDQSVDIVICIDTFQYLTKSEAKKAVQELRRVARRFLCFECITKEDTKFSDPKENPDPERKHQSLFSEQEYLTLFKENGFRLKKKRFLPRAIPAKPYPHEFSFNAIFEVTPSS
ncbi:MAG TPA: methyltransferase domain-containing protein [Candidatus Peribacterales bacterium]|nr:methyltransferase domain-containing protein [Candidatus Peribacterales bacterium]